MQEEGQSEQQAQPSAGWVFTPGAAPHQVDTSQSSAPDSNSGSVATGAQDNIVTWTASEYIGNTKSTSWFAMLAAATVAVTVIVYLITSDITSVIVIIILGIIIGVFAARQPQVLQYSLDRSGIYIGSRFFPYGSFKTFSIVGDDAFNHISLLPLKRFVPPIAIHYSPDDEDKITTTLADYLPLEAHKRDLIENFSRRVRF